MNNFEDLFLTLQQADDVVDIDIIEIEKKLTRFVLFNGLVEDEDPKPELYIGGYVKPLGTRTGSGNARSRTFLESPPMRVSFINITKYCNHPELTGQRRRLKRRGYFSLFPIHEGEKNYNKLAYSPFFECSILRSQLITVCESAGIPIDKLAQTEDKQLSSNSNGITWNGIQVKYSEDKRTAESLREFLVLVEQWPVAKKALGERPVNKLNIATQLIEIQKALGKSVNISNQTLVRYRDRLKEVNPILARELPNIFK